MVSGLVIAIRSSLLKRLFPKRCPGCQRLSLTLPMIQRTKSAGRAPAQSMTRQRRRCDLAHRARKASKSRMRIYRSDLGRDKESLYPGGPGCVVVPLTLGTTVLNSGVRALASKVMFGSRSAERPELGLGGTNLKTTVMFSKKSLTGGHAVDFHDGNGCDCHRRLLPRNRKGSPL
jgi:hypothetical protein